MTTGRRDECKVLSRIRPTLNYGDFKDGRYRHRSRGRKPQGQDRRAEPKWKAWCSEDTILASNTSTISITYLAKALQRPENFVGMHFFNPVHMMPLVEVIRGEKTSDAAVAATVKLAQKMGKTPIVVNDCPGFLVNRVLFPYFGGFDMLVRDGADFQAVDKVDGAFRLAHGPGLPARRGRYRYRRARCGQDHGRRLPRPHAARTSPSHGTRNACSKTNRLRPEERQGLLHVYEQDKKGKPKKVVRIRTTYELHQGRPIAAERKEFDARGNHRRAA